jgi:hypothetical protein
MLQQARATIDMILDQKPGTLIGALVLSLFAAALLAGLYRWLSRGRSDAASVLTALILVSNLTCLGAGAGFMRSRILTQVDSPPRVGPKFDRGPGRGLGRRLPGFPEGRGRHPARPALDHWGPPTDDRSHA